MASSAGNPAAQHHFGQQVGSALVSEKQMVQEKTTAMKKTGLQNVRMRVYNYLSQENFWVSELAGQEEVNTNEFVRRIITMGQFLDSKAIEHLPNNPYLGRRIASQFAQFISESSGDFSAHKKNSTFLQNISPNLKAHSLLYILHQSFKHENRFAQLFDLGQALPRPTVANRFGGGDLMDEDAIIGEVERIHQHQIQLIDTM